MPDDQNSDNPFANLDPANLPPEVQSIVDAARSQASETARKNALKDADKDPKVRERIKAEIEAQANQTAEERLAAQQRDIEAKQRELAVKTNQVSAVSKLVGEGIERERAEKVAALLAVDDEAATLDRVAEYLDDFKGAVDSKVETLKAELLANGGAPKGGEGDENVSDADKLQAEYDGLTKAGNKAAAIAVMRKAQVQGITLKEPTTE